jgi:hypothetical protein
MSVDERTTEARTPLTTPADDTMQRFLAGRDVPCPACGYNLRGLEGSACPECNEALALRIGLVEPRQGAFIAGLVGLAVGIWFCIGVLCLAAVVAVMRGGTAGLLAESWPLVLNLAIESVALAAGVKSRRWLRRLPPRKRAALAAGCWGLSIALAVYFFMLAFETI